jgi:hypothetical protein
MYTRATVKREGHKEKTNLGMFPDRGRADVRQLAVPGAEFQSVFQAVPLVLIVCGGCRCRGRDGTGVGDTGNFCEEGIIALSRLVSLCQSVEWEQDQRIPIDVPRVPVSFLP